MEKELTKRKKGAKVKHDFSTLKVGEFVSFKGAARRNPYPYVAAWNKRSEIKIEVWRDGQNRPYAKRVL